MRRNLETIAKFMMAFFVMTIVCTVFWEKCISDKLYNCTDPGFFGYLMPGDWVHSWNNHPVMIAPQVIPDSNMNDPDTIKEGWTISRLWELWFLFFAVSLIGSAALAWLPWPSLRPHLKN